MNTDLSDLDGSPRLATIFMVRHPAQSGGDPPNQEEIK